MQPASPLLLDTQWSDLTASVSTAIDLEATARTSGALVRRRGVRSAETLLRLALAYGPGGLSLRGAAAWAGVSGLANLSDTAVMNRLRHAAGWLGEVAGALLRRAAAASPVPGPLPGRRLRIVDASTVTGPGGRPKWRLHASYDPVAGRFTGIELTDDRGAEGFGRTAWQPGEVALGDRCYARPRRCGAFWRRASISSCAPAGRGYACLSRTGRLWRGSGSLRPCQSAGSLNARSRSTTPAMVRGPAARPHSPYVWWCCALPRRRQRGRPRRSTAGRTAAAVAAE